MSDAIKVSSLSRDLQGSEIQVRAEENTTRLTFPASSEEPVERFFGEEVLSHDKSAIRLDRVKRGAMPLLFNHNWDDPIGLVDAARIENKRLVVDAHLFDTPRAQEISAMVTSGLRNVSIGYRLHTIKEETKTNRFTAIDWEPYEISIVTVPADPTVGIGRTSDGELEVRVIRHANEERFASDVITAVDHMKKAVKIHEGHMDGSVDTDEESQQEMMDHMHAAMSALDDEAMESMRSKSEGRMVRSSNTPAVPAIHIKETSMEKGQEQRLAAEAAEAAEKVRKEEQERAASAERKARDELANMNAVEMEKGRQAAIRNLAAANKVGENFVEAWIRGGASLEKVSKDILDIAEERGRTNPQPASKLGLSEKETQTYSLARAIMAMQDQNWSGAEFEAECSRAIAQKLGRTLDNKTILVPFEALTRPVQKRDLTVASAGGGGYLVGTENQGFIEILRNRAVSFQMGAQRLSGLTANITVPRQSAAATAYWLSSESTQITESQQTFVQMALTPKTAGAYTEISRQLLLQSSPAAESIVTNDLAQVLSLAVDVAVLNGSGSSGQPTGIINTSGIGSTTATSVDYGKILDFQEDLATSNVMPGQGGYVTTPAVAKILMNKFINSTGGETPLWVGNIWDGRMAGYKAMSSNQMPTGAMLFGDWSEVVVGEWGVLEVSVNPYANFTAGIIGVRAIYSMDVGVRRPFAFSYASSVTA